MPYKFPIPQRYPVDSTIHDRPELIVGFVVKRKNTITNGYTVMLNAKEAGLNLPKHKWALFCTFHKSYHHYSSWGKAMKDLTAPELWCVQCHNTKNLTQS